jgi:hypothetical protein
MFRSFGFSLALLCFSCPVLIAQTSTYSDRQLAHLEKTAQSQTDYQTLVQGFAAAAQRFSALAEEQRAAHQHGTEHPLPGARFPTAADTSRRMQEYYALRAEQAQAKRNMYRSKLK